MADFSDVVLAQLEDKSESFFRLPKEGEKPFEAFCLYRDAGAQRSLRRVARALGKSDTLIKRWSSAWMWNERARDWDNAQERARKEGELEAVREAAKRHALVGVSMLRAGTLRLSNILTDEKEIQKIPVGILPQWMKVAVDIERGARGMQDKLQVTTEEPANESMEAFRETFDKDEVRSLLIQAAHIEASVEGEPGLDGDPPDEG